MIDVSRTGDGDPMQFRVVIRDEDGATRHEVTLRRDFHEAIASGATPETAVEAAFRFLLDREPKEAILGHFDITVISSYFPEFPQAIAAYLPERG
ncbi:MAG: hypothetical protein CMI62_07305 [Parvibaculum sp.]|jgi:hypothetical protein|uniref:hypothetical protein n=1 Tax=Parvibaculum sp. TaxID=2024848 RepID=UPI000C6484B0|nr:hypothetical protein [Parvibaculum sp.]MAU60519.1 hypothetical protein [Parvibaculum sp.]|tara:strand:- start:1131 stop:1415 length:285 start_codon:yes stop_codon:yes gene_type:complete